VTIIPKVEFYYDPDHHTNDGRKSTEGDIEDLKWESTHGSSVEDAATLLCRPGTVEEVRAKELGLVK
jgi:hypothetical protein